MSKLSLVIVAKNEPYLERTIQDIKAKATGEIEILVDDRVGEGNDMRQKINDLVSKATGEYIMKLDAHCLLAHGFDEQLIKDHEPNWVQVPRRKRLDAEKWEVIEDGRLPVDYESILFPQLVTPVGGVKGFIWATPWNDMTRLKSDILIDDTPHFQGSCWFMTKEWFNKCGLMSLDYGGFAQEPEEIIFTTIKNHGRVKVNKNTWYAHLHKDEKAREWFKLDSEDMAKGYNHSLKTWVGDKDFFTNFINMFPPMPGWPEKWEKILW